MSAIADPEPVQALREAAAAPGWAYAVGVRMLFAEVERWKRAAAIASPHAARMVALEEVIEAERAEVKADANRRSAEGLLASMNGRRSGRTPEAIADFTVKVRRAEQAAEAAHRRGKGARAVLAAIDTPQHRRANPGRGL